MDSTEAKLHGLAAKADGLASRVGNLDHKVDSSLISTRNQTREMVKQATGHLQAELDRRGETVDARLRNVESTQTQEQAQLVQLNEELQGQVASLREQLTAAQQNTGRDLANVQQEASNNQGDLHALAQSLRRNKMTFELVKNSPTELAPGVTLTILNTDANYQRFNGYISLTDEGKTMWLKNLSAEETVDLYSQHYGHPYSLIVTAVNEDGVAGYLLLPAGA
jgi:chromosome segregation ATPase